MCIDLLLGGTVAVWKQSEREGGVAHLIMQMNAGASALVNVFLSHSHSLVGRPSRGSRAWGLVPTVFRALNSAGGGAVQSGPSSGRRSKRPPLLSSLPSGIPAVTPLRAAVRGPDQDRPLRLRRYLRAFIRDDAHVLLWR